MPVAAPGQLPLPPLQTYVALSFLFLAWSLLQAREGLSLIENLQAKAGAGSSPADQAHMDQVEALMSSLEQAGLKEAFPDPGEEGPLKPALEEILSGIDPEEDPSTTLQEPEAVSDDIPSLGLDTSPADESTPYDAYLSRPGPNESGLSDSPQSGPEGGPYSEDHVRADGVGFVPKEELLQSLALDLDIGPDDSDMVKIMKLMLQDSLSVVVVINMAFCCLILLGKAIQHVVFGDLRVIERQHLRDKLWNFSFYKLIVVFGVLNVQTLEELVLWLSWFAVLAFLHGFAQLSKDRYEYLSFSPTTATRTHSLVIGLLTLILTVTGLLMVASFYLCYHFDWNLLFFMLAECFLVTVRAIYVLARYTIHLYDLHHEGVWENRGSLIYHTELVLELVTLSLDFVHHLHMLLWVNVFLSMASLLICMQLRHLYYEIQRRVQRHRNYRRVVANMEARFPRATDEELVVNNDDCAICWEELKGARKLPCGHLFHDACLRSWLEHETSCPTCRQSLNIQTAPSIHHPTPGRGPGAGGRPNPAAMMGGGEARPNQPLNLRNHFFHFDGSRIFSWLPSFSVEVTHTQVLRAAQAAHTSQLDNMARQVSQMFTNVPYRAILDDLRITRSVELTVDNILDGRLASLGMGGDNATPEDTQDAPPTDTFPAFRAPPHTPGAEDEGGLLYRQTRQPGLGEEGAMGGEGSSGVGDGAGEAERAMEGSEDNAANWNRPDSGLPREGVSSESTDSELSGGFPSYSSRFSKSSSERETSLRQRKEKLLQLARRKFQDRQLKESQAHSQSASSSHNQPLPSSSVSSSSSSSSLSSSMMPSTSSTVPRGSLGERLSMLRQPRPGLGVHQGVLFSTPAPGPQVEGEGEMEQGGTQGTQGERQRVRAAALEAALRRLQQQQRPL